MNSYHIPVLLKEIIDNLKIKEGQKYIDATIGGGGHSFEILKRCGVVLGIDVDQEATDYVRRRWKIESRKRKIEEANLILIRGNFRDIDKIAKENVFDKVAGILFDLGVSSHQLEMPERGFSFQKQGPLDMRMDQGLKITAKDLLNVLTKGELYELFTKMAEESTAWQLSDRIIRARRIRPITTTRELVEILYGSNPRFYNFKKLARVFQALRIAVNDELNALKEAIPQAIDLLNTGGRILIISFQSLEDRIVKQSFIEFEKKNMGAVITKKPIPPTPEELEKNNKARSAKLRVFEKI